TLMGRLGDVDNVLAPYGGLVVGEGEGRGAILERGRDHIVGRQVNGANVVSPGLGDVPILAEEAAHVAARGAHGKNLGPREKMIERLLFDGINLDGGGPAVTELYQPSAFILADE